MLIQLAGVALAQAVEHEELAPVIAPPFVVGGIMFAFLMILMLVCVSFMNLGNRHDAVAHVEDPHKQHTNKHAPHTDAASHH